MKEDLENHEKNHKNKLYRKENKNGKNLEFETLDEHMEGGRRLFTIGAVVDGALIAEGKAYNKKDASQIAASIAINKLGLAKLENGQEENNTGSWFLRLSTGSFNFLVILHLSDRDITFINLSNIRNSE